MMTRASDVDEMAAALRLGRRLQWATIAWNCVEVVVTMYLGIVAGSLALVAFGLDSLVEVFASAVVIWHMAPGEPGGDGGGERDVRAMRLVAGAFGALAVYLAVAGGRALWLHDPAEPSPAGIVYLGVTAAVMFTMAAAKRRVARALQSEPFAAEASMTFLDGALASSILVALALNWGLGWWWADPAAALLVAAAAAHEALEHWRD